MSELATTYPNKTSEASIKMAKAFRNLQCAVTQSHDAVFITDAAGLISRVNPAFEKLTSYSSIEVIGKDMSLLIADGPQSGDYGQIWNRIFQQRAFSGPVRLKKKSGEHCDTDMTLTPLSDGRGQITNVVCSCQVLRDGTEVVRVSSALGRLLLDCEPIKTAAASSTFVVPVGRSIDRPTSACGDNA